MIVEGYGMSWKVVEGQRRLSNFVECHGILWKFREFAGVFASTGVRDPGAS
jgi:hypothetical protein